MVPGTILTVGPSLGDLLIPLGAFGPRKNKDQPELFIQKGEMRTLVREPL